MFSVLHHSPSPRMIASEEEPRAVEPLYCVASGHNLKYKYTWDNITGVVGVNSPIFYAFELGTYRCTVTNEYDEVAYSPSIVVREGTRPSVCMVESQLVIVQIKFN